MVSNLYTFGYSANSRNMRDRLSASTKPMMMANDLPMSSGSYRRIIDNSSSLYWRTSIAGRALKKKYPDAWWPSVFLDYGGPLWIEDVSISEPTGFLGTMRKIPTGPYQWRSPVIGSAAHFTLYRQLASGKTGELTKRLNLLGPSYSDMVQWGTQGIARSVPTIPSTSLFTILGELREGFSLPGRSVYNQIKNLPKWAKTWEGPVLKGLSSEFLNWIFGIAPTLSDAEGLVLFNTEKVKRAREKLRRDCDAIYKRRRTLKDEVTQTVSEGYGYCQNPPNSWLNPSKGLIRTVVTTHEKVWFVGAFNHSAWKPSLDESVNRILNDAEDLGLLPNLERVWQLIPYSWLVDWFLNMGEVFTNISYLGHNGLTMLYGYVMSDTKRTESVTWTGTINGIPVESTTVLTQRVRARIKATPYGFGLKIRDLTPMQLAILAALGISRTRLRKTGVLP